MNPIASAVRAVARLLFPPRTTQPASHTVTVTSTPTDGAAPARPFAPIQVGDLVAYTPEHIRDFLLPPEASHRRGRVV